MCGHNARVTYLDHRQRTNPSSRISGNERCSDIMSLANWLNALFCQPLSYLVLFSGDNLSLSIMTPSPFSPSNNNVHCNHAVPQQSLIIIIIIIIIRRRDMSLSRYKGALQHMIQKNRSLTTVSMILTSSTAYIQIQVAQ